VQTSFFSFSSFLLILLLSRKSTQLSSLFFLYFWRKTKKKEMAFKDKSFEKEKIEAKTKRVFGLEHENSSKKSFFPSFFCFYFVENAILFGFCLATKNKRFLELFFAFVFNVLSFCFVC
jgi:hypothetical protein